jgi:hypothetical protein
MIGRLEGKGWTATLTDEGAWECDDDFRLVALQLLFDPGGYSEADGPFGRRLLTEAAARLGAKVAWPKPPAAPAVPAPGPKNVAGGGPAGPLDVWLYACDRGHFHVVVDREVDDPALLRVLKEICRDELGRFASCPGASGGGSGSGRADRAMAAEAHEEKAHNLIKDILDGPRPVPADKVAALHDHLANLTVKQINAIKKQYGLKASGRNKDALRAKVAARLAAVPAAEHAPAPAGESPARAPEPPVQDHVPPGTFGPSKATIEDEHLADALAAEVLGPGKTARDLASCAGAPDGARVEIARADFGTGIEVNFNGSAKVKDKETGKIKDEIYVGMRTFSRKGGKVYVHNDSFTGEGSGLAMFGRQVENATVHGIDHIETIAAGSFIPGPDPNRTYSAYNGYYTWPRFGYDAQVPSFVAVKLEGSFKADVEAAGGNVRGLMQTEEGRKWWLRNGYDIEDAHFDLAKGSYSQQTLNAYLRKQGLLK